MEGGKPPIPRRNFQPRMNTDGHGYLTAKCAKKDGERDLNRRWTQMDPTKGKTGVQRRARGRAAFVRLRRAKGRIGMRKKIGTVGTVGFANFEGSVKWRREN
jgi:hypothetical protein